MIEEEPDMFNIMLEVGLKYLLKFEAISIYYRYVNLVGILMNWSISETNLFLLN